MLWVGLTGCMGCGKTTVGEHYKSLGYEVYSADSLIKELYVDKAVVKEILRAFNFDPLLSSQELIQKLSKTVFTNQEKLKTLESILHPKLRDKVSKIKEKLINNKTKVAFYDVPLLFEKNMQDGFDFIICVGLDEEIQKNRIKKRNKDWSESDIESRIKNQLSILKKKNLSDFYIDNNKSLDDLYIAAEKILKKITS